MNGGRGGRDGGRVLHGVEHGWKLELGKARPDDPGASVIAISGTCRLRLLRTARCVNNNQREGGERHICTLAADSSSDPMAGCWQAWQVGMAEVRLTK